MKQMLRDEAATLQAVKKALETSKTQQGWLTDKTEVISQQMAELMRAAETIAARNSSCGTPGDSGGSQDSSSERMRAFMM